MPGLLWANSLFVYQILSVPPDLAIGIALWIDWRQGLRYPWTHWLGIAVFYWGTVVGWTWLVLR